jgi:hypothetical protein
MQLAVWLGAKSAGVLVPRLTVAGVAAGVDRRRVRERGELIGAAA